MIKLAVKFFIPNHIFPDTANYHEMAFKVSSLLTTGIISFLYIFLSLYVQFYVGIYVCLFFVFSHWGLLLSLKKGLASENMISHLFGLMTIIGLGICSYYTGGHESPVLLWLVSTLVVSFWFADVTTSRLWVGIVLLMLSFFFLGYALDYPFPIDLNINLFGFFKFSMTVGIFIFLTVVFKTFDRWRMEALKELRDVSQMKDRMMSMVAHDLKNPLMVMMGHIGLAKSGKPLSDKSLTLFESLNSRMNQIIDNMLIFERLQKGKFLFDFKEFDINDVLRSLHSEFSDQAAYKEIKFILQTDGPLVAISDRLALERILTNLISNALNYTPSHKSVILSLVNKQIYVKDEGVGLSDEVKMSMFKIYQNHSNLLQHKNDESNGIGLYIVKELCDQLNYEITAESAGPNQGATFILNLAPNKG